MKAMKTFILTAGVLTAAVTQAQTTAMNYAFTDCAGNTQEIFADLDAGKAVILEFFMTSCSPCVTAGGQLEAMKTDLLAEYPGMIKSYAFGYSNSYTCSAINNWVTSNGFTSIPSDSGGAQVAYYGGMGMPTIVILGGGPAHLVLGSPYIGFSTSDTTTMANDIRNSLNSLGAKEHQTIVNQLNLYPNPASTQINVSFNLVQTANVVMDVLDLTGRLVTNITNEKMQAGNVNKTITTTALAKGNYLVRIRANEAIIQQKITIVH